jgi:hypothetical protein
METRKVAKADLLRMIPNGTKRIAVVDDTGKEKWRKVEEVFDTDMIQFKDGEPRTMKRDPGRKKDPTATPPVNENVEALIKAKYKGMDEDALTTIIERDPESIDVLHEVMRGIAQESASLEFERKESERKGDDTRQVSVSRLQALKAVGDTWIKRAEQLQAKGVNMSSPEFKMLLGFLIRTFRDALVQTGLRREQIEKIFSLLSQRLNDETWEDEARAVMRGDTKQMEH